MIWTIDLKDGVTDMFMLEQMEIIKKDLLIYVLIINFMYMGWKDVKTILISV